jgi:hypothetical protein
MVIDQTAGDRIVVKRQSRRFRPEFRVIDRVVEGLSQNFVDIHDPSLPQDRTSPRLNQSDEMDPIRQICIVPKIDFLSIFEPNCNRSHRRDRVDAKRNHSYREVSGRLG